MKSESTGYESIIKQSLNTIRILEARLEALEKRPESQAVADEPVAVIGMACRFPGGCTTPEAFWKFLEEKGDGVTDIPRDRWDADAYYDPDAKTFGKMYVRQAGFMQEDISEFDAGFFRISPAEAREMDPQHRLLLETAWEALERAGQNPDRLRGTNTGVFVGIIASEYAMLPRDPAKINMYAGTGTINCIASGRISHILGLCGPAVSTDTACSSSMVSLHYACQSLKTKECDMALAGGVNLLLLPESFSYLCMMGALNRDGRCRPFDADGQGYGRGEGCGLVVLKRLSDAEKDRDPILAVIRGSAVNHDGAGSGLTVPNGNAQKELVIKALENSHTQPDEVGYMEAHGTGTSLGDPIEINALTEVFGTKTRKSPLIVGSVKGNIGHLEGAAGIAGLIKTVLCIQNGKIPANINLDKPNPRIRFEKIPAKVPLSLTDWDPEPEKPLVAGMSSFGFSGTNAHLIVSEPPRTSAPEKQAGRMPFSIMKLSAKSRTALENLAARYQEYVESHPDSEIGEISHTANRCRADFPHRAAFVAEDTRELVALLAAFQEDKKDPRVFYGKKEEDAKSKTAFFFTEPSQLPGASASWAYHNIPFFRDGIGTCSDMFAPCINASVEKLISQTRSDLSKEPEIVGNASVFSVQYALFRLWESLGAPPFAVFGKEIGFYAAAAASGAISLETAVRLVAGHDREISPDECKAPVCRFLSPGDGRSLKKDAVASLLRQSAIPSSRVDYDELEKELREQGCDFFVKIEANPPEWKELLGQIALFYCRGMDIRWHDFHAGHSHSKILLPTYPFERKSYWIAPPDPDAEVLEPKARPLEGIRISSPFVTDKIGYEYRLDMNNLPGLADTSGVVHVGYWQEMLDRGLKSCFGTGTYFVKEMDFASAAIVGDKESKLLHLAFTQDLQNKEAEFLFYGKDRSAGQWDLHIRGMLVTEPEISLPDPEPAHEIKRRCRENYPKDIFYQMMESRDIKVGEGLKLIEEVWRRDNEALARLKLPLDSGKADAWGIGFDPGILDACAQLFHAALPDSAPSDMMYMVVRWEDFALTGISGHEELWCHATIDTDEDYTDSLSGAFTLSDGKGRVVCFARRNIMKGISDAMVQAMKQASEVEKDLDAELIGKLRDAPYDEKKMILADYFRNAMAGILEASPSELDIKEPLRDMGMDSLVAVSFKSTVASRLDMDIPVEMLIEGPSIFELAERATALMGAKPDTRIKGRSGNGFIDRERWFYHRRKMPDAKVRLFCLPYGGGGASLFREWQDMLPDYIEVCPVQLPGKENRISDPPIDNIVEMTDMLEKVLAPEIDRPYAFYGHSLGALIAFCAVRRLSKIFPKIPARLFAGAFRSPLIYPSPTRESMRRRIFQDPRWAALENNELKEALAKVLESDMKILASWKSESEPLSDIPITVFHGEDDDHILLEHTEGWKELTTGVFTRHILPGDHFFLEKDQSRDRMLELIAEELDSGFAQSADIGQEKEKTPLSPEEITPGWLTRVLRSTGTIRDASVVSAKTEEIGDIKGFIGSVVRLGLGYKGNSNGAPDSLIAKFPSADPHLRKVFGNLRFYENEIRFYREIAGTADISVPRHYYSAMHTDAHRYLLVLEDMSPTARVGDCVAGCSYNEAEIAIRHIAGFHADLWEKPRIKAYKKRIPALADEAAFIQEQYRQCLPEFRRARPDTVSDYLADVAEQLADHIPSVYNQWAGMPQTLVHGDYRLDNLFFGLPGCDRDIVVGDWQNLRIGPGVTDAAFFLSLNIDPVMRKAHEQDFLKAYCSVLEEKGVKEYAGRSLADYRWSLFFPLIRCMIFFSGPRTNRTEALLSVKLERMSSAAEDHGLADMFS